MTSSSAVAERPRDRCVRQYSFNSVIPRAQSFIIVTSASDHLITTAYTIKCCSVVFGVTLMLLVIHVVVVCRQKQTPSLTSECHQLVGLSRLSVLHFAFTARHTWFRIAISAYLTYRRSIAMTFSMEKLVWCGYHGHPRSCPGVLE